MDELIAEDVDLLEKYSIMTADTGKLDFEELEEPFEITGKLGYYIFGKGKFMEDFGDNFTLYPSFVKKVNQNDWSASLKVSAGS